MCILSSYYVIMQWNILKYFPRDRGI